MNDSISRAAVLEIIREYCPDEPKSKDLREYWEKRFEPLIKVREEVEKMPLSDGWIPCSERLPEEEKAYLVTFACEKVGMSSWHKDTLYNRGFDAYLTGLTEGGECEYFGVVAWMEKPEPWKGEQNGEKR